jgi:polypeptide N-acetylgalactosaminyltransferase
MVVPPSRPLFDKSCLRHANHVPNYDDSVSVVICHKNELVYSLMRVLTAIEAYTPRNILEEVVIIDDGSESDESAEIRHFGTQLGLSIQTLRNSVSVGISACRHKGIRAARGGIIAILDSHMEVSNLWLQSLLEILRSKPRSLAVPLVHMINENLYSAEAENIIQPYTYEMTYGYTTMHWSRGGPPNEDRSQPFPSPSLGGGAIVAYKSMLMDVYPKGVNEKYLWGIENNRLALRAWLCGDGVWMTGCSQVSHLNGPDHALKRYGGFFQMRSELQMESLAEILNFMDSKKERADLLDRSFFTDQYNQNLFVMAGKISKDFDYKLLCTKNYSWYLKNVHRSLDYKFFESTNFISVGEIQSIKSDHCLYCELMSSEGVYAEPTCRRENIVFWDSHMFGFGKDGAVYTSHPDILCWDAGIEGDGVRISQSPCQNKLHEGRVYDSQKFVYNETSLQIRHPSSNRCVELVRSEGKIQVLLKTCATTDLQKWSINKPKWIT